MPAPPPPSALTPNTRDRLAVSGPQAQVTLSWQPSAGATSYAVRVNDNTAPHLRYPNNNCEDDPHYLCVNFLDTTSVSFPARAGHDYTWWVYAINDAGWSAAATAGFRMGSPPTNDASYSLSALGVYVTAPPYREVLRPAPSSWGANLIVNRVLTGEGDTLTIQAELRDPRDRVVATGQASLRGGDLHGVRHGVLGMSAPDLAAGTYRWQFRLLNPGGTQLDFKEIELRVVETEPTVYIKAGQIIRKAGVPFFPLVMYEGVVEGDENLSRIASFGFNAVMNYTFGLYSYGQGNEAQAIRLARNYLDAAQRHGIGVFYNLGNFFPGHIEFPHVDKTNLELATEYITALRDHPALLGWYIADEPRLPHSIPWLLSMYQLVRDLDPKHPALIVQFAHWLDPTYSVMDISGVDPYPIPELPLTVVTDWSDLNRISARNAKPPWTVIQLHAPELYYPISPPGRREPTLAEKRCMVYLALAAQARGLMFFSYFDHFRELIYDSATGQPVVVTPPVDPTLAPRRLSELSAIGTELRSLGPKLLSGQPRPLAPQNAGQVRTRAVEYGGYLWVLLANPSDAADPINIGLPAGSWAGVDAPHGTVSGQLLDGSTLRATVPARNGGYLRVARAGIGGRRWALLPGTANDVGVGAEGTAWVIGTNSVAGGFGIYRWSGTAWQRFDGGAVRIAVGPQGEPWVVNSAGNIYRRGANRWGLLPGRAKDIGVGADGSAWIIGAETHGGGFRVCRWTGKEWEPTDGGGVRIAVGPLGEPWVVTSSQQILRHDGIRWSLLPGAAQDIGVGADGTACVIGTNGVGGGFGIYRWTGTAWQPVDGGATEISVQPDGLAWVVNSAHQIFRRSA